MLRLMTTTDLKLSGMSCASCAAKVERGLNKLGGVHASVNFAVEQAHVEHDSNVSADDLVHAVESTGYHASVIDHAHHGGDASADSHDHLNHDVPTERLRPRLIGSALLAVPVLALSAVVVIAAAWTASRHPSASVTRASSDPPLAAQIHFQPSAFGPGGSACACGLCRDRHRGTVCPPAAARQSLFRDARRRAVIGRCLP